MYITWKSAILPKLSKECVDKRYYVNILYPVYKLFRSKNQITFADLLNRNNDLKKPSYF